MTFKREELQRGFEPDSSFYFQHEPQVAGSRQIDIATDPPPDLLIEIDVATSSLNTLPMYAQLGIPDVWRHEDATERAIILKLDEGTHQRSTMSIVLPPVSDDVLTRFVQASRTKQSS